MPRVVLGAVLAALVGIPAVAWLASPSAVPGPDQWVVARAGGPGGIIWYLVEPLLAPAYLLVVAPIAARYLTRKLVPAIAPSTLRLVGAVVLAFVVTALGVSALGSTSLAGRGAFLMGALFAAGALVAVHHVAVSAE